MILRPLRAMYAHELECPVKVLVGDEILTILRMHFPGKLCDHDTVVFLAVSAYTGIEFLEASPGAPIMVVL